MTSIICRENGILFIRAMSQLMTICLSLNWPLFIVWDKYLNLYQRGREGGRAMQTYIFHLYLWSLSAFNKITPLNLKQNNATKIYIYINLWFMLFLKNMIEDRAFFFIHEVTVSRVIPSGFPVSSSSRTSRFPVDFRRDLGMWYLNKNVQLWVNKCLTSRMVD